MDRRSPSAPLRSGVCLDSTHAAVKKAAGPLLLEALRKAGDSERLLDERSGDLVGQGTDPGVATADGATLVMVEAALGRDRLVRTDGGFVTRRAHERFGLADLERLAQQEPQRLSPNVLLRPVVESAFSQRWLTSPARAAPAALPATV
jgi:uncharacterized protein YllA (UPF0747 family)